MHLHAHLADCIKDYGSIYGYWLFSFERYNGTLGNFPTNKKCISEQLMRFIYESECYHIPLPEIFREEFAAVILNQRCTEVHKRRVLITANHPSKISSSYIYLQYHNTARLDRLILTILQCTHIYM